MCRVRWIFGSISEKIFRMIKICPKYSINGFCKLENLQSKVCKCSIALRVMCPGLESASLNLLFFTFLLQIF